MQFSRHGIPQIVISDNGSQYASTRFARFASGWHFQLSTSSPLHSQVEEKLRVQIYKWEDVMIIAT